MNIAAAGFDWDGGNLAKCRKHGVCAAEVEELFDRSLSIVPDMKHSQDEERFCAIGRTAADRPVFLVFTFRKIGRKKLIRPISARYMHEREIRAYEEDNSNL